MFLSGLGDASDRVEQAGDRIFVRFSRRYHRELASRLALKGGQLAVGMLLSYPELASLAPINPNWSDTELTYYRNGSPILHYAWSEEGAVVNLGSTLPHEVIMSAIEGESLGPIPVKGKAEPVEVWWLKGLKPRVRG
ncbi:MAG TPA: hypothetical protein VJN91_00150 [Gammaproteobacteria bacterium]|nr:hypothetical protein [Gammaproteobacteria bacterium]